MDGPRKDTFDVLKELAGLANSVAAEAVLDTVGATRKPRTRYVARGKV